MTTLFVTIGCLAGFALGYWLGRRGEEKRTEAWVQEKSKDVERWKCIANYAASEGVDILAAEEVAELERLYRE